MTAGGRLVFEAMGTVVSVLLPSDASGAVAGVPGPVAERVTGAFEELEARFSLYRAATEGAAVARRDLPMRHASAEYRAVYDLAVDWRARTAGAFTPHRPDGAVDLSGVVKALAIAAAGDLLDAAGLDGWCVNAGGDVLVRGENGPGRPWVVGIVDPDDRTSLLSQYTSDGRRRAVATSGTAERGEHVWRTGADATFRQVTVVADDIVTADVLATAILAGGRDALARAQDGWPIEALACGADGRYWPSPAFRS